MLKEKEIFGVAPRHFSRNPSEKQKKMYNVCTLTIYPNHGTFSLGREGLMAKSVEVRRCRATVRAKCSSQVARPDYFPQTSQKGGGLQNFDS